MRELQVAEGVFLSSRPVPLDRLQERMSPASPPDGKRRSWTRAERGGSLGWARQAPLSVSGSRLRAGLVVGAQRVFRPGGSY